MAKPERLEVVVENFPREILSLNNWVLWRWEQRNGRWTKPPYTAAGEFAKSDDPRTWADCDTVLAAYHNGGGWDGVGFVLTPEAGLTGIDWDNCIIEDGKINPEFLRHIEKINSYTETSPSGRGMKTLVRGTLPAGGHHNVKAGIEIGVFNRLRYFCLTGRRVSQFSEKIEARQSELDELIRHFWPEDFGPRHAVTHQTQRPVDLSESELIQKALGANDGGKFRRLWSGDISDYDNDDSRADQALCNKLAFWCGRDAEKIDALFRQSGLMRSKWDREDYRRRTITKAIEATAETYDPGRRTAEAVCIRTQAPAAANPGPIVSSSEVLHALGRGEDGDAELFRKSHQGGFAYDHADRRWYQFDGHFWKLDRTENALAAVSDVITLYLQEAKQQAKAKHTATVEARKEDVTRHAAIEGELLKRISKLHGRQRKENVLTLAAAGAGSLGITGLEWDGNPWAIGCKNGVVDLKTGRMRAGLPGDYIKTVASGEWAGLETPCPVWERFLSEVFDGDKAIIDYMQELLGYGLTGLTPLHIIPILFGRGRNGKGTLLETVKHVLGAYAFKAEAEMLLEQRSAKAPNAHNSAVLALQGKRLVWTSEIDEGRRFNAAKVKELVGGDTLSGRAAYGRDHKEFAPSHLLLLLTNAKPSANPADYALWQRIHLVEFGLSFVQKPEQPNERKADLCLGEKLKAEASGILAWMVRGCLRYLENGLTVPEQVRAAVARYRAEEDIIGNFISERCEEKETGKTAKGTLYQAYKFWCADNGHSALSSKRFFQQMDGRFDSYHNGRHSVYIGIRVEDDLQSLQSQQSLS